MDPASKRLSAWMQERGLTLVEAGRMLECSYSYVGHLRSGRRTPSRRVANQIERVTATWPAGPIRAMEWDRVRPAEGPG
ncbi:MAG: helix-turn-helix domain-containing protein [Myxococcota bacterium]